LKLSPLSIACLFVVGAAGGLVGDHGHVVTGTTRLAPTDVPFVWDSALWFPLMVGTGTVAVAEIRLHLAPPPRTEGGIGDAVAGIAAVLGIYAVTALIAGEPLGPGTTLVAALAAITWVAIGDGRAAAICGVLAAIGGATTEIVMIAAGIFEYDDAIDHLLGIPFWLLALYFAFGVVAARLGELAFTRQSAPASP
jgi:hypothetical protein